MTPPELKWPKAGDGAFREAKPPICVLQLCAFVTPSDATYTLGFRLAADAVIEKARQESTQPDLLLIPVAYLYRHYLELMLKNLVHMGVKGNLIVVSDNRLTRHDLGKLWQSAKEMVEAFWPASPSDDLNAVEQVIREFHHFDPDGQSLRYAYNKSGNANLSGVPAWIDLDVLQSTMKAVANFLEAVETGIDDADPGPP